MCMRGGGSRPQYGLFSVKKMGENFFLGWGMLGWPDSAHHSCFQGGEGVGGEGLRSGLDCQSLKGVTLRKGV